MVDALRSQHIIPTTLTVDTGDPYAEPLLWLPDLIAGAVIASELGNDHYLKPLTGKLTTERLTIT